MLGQYQTFEEVRSAIERMRYQMGGTETGDALTIVNEKVRIKLYVYTLRSIGPISYPNECDLIVNPRKYSVIFSRMHFVTFVRI